MSSLAPINTPSSTIYTQTLSQLEPVKLFEKSKVTSGYLQVEKDWEIYYEESGNPNGQPVVFVHGGPGFQARDKDHQWFDPTLYRIILFDQRGTGKSKPSAFDPSQSSERFSKITIKHLSEDMELLRKHLKIEKWHVFGGSWGSAMSIYYAQENPESVLSMVLRGITFISHAENVRFFDPEVRINQWGKRWDPSSLNCLVEYLELRGYKVDLKDVNTLLDGFYDLNVLKNDPIGMHLWSCFEEYIDDPTPEALAELKSSPKNHAELDPVRRSCGIFEPLFFRDLPRQLNLLDDNRLFNLCAIPIRIIQGEDDTVCPKEFALKLHHALTKPQVTKDKPYMNNNVVTKIIVGGQHSADSEPMTRALIHATNEFSCYFGQKDPVDKHVAHSDPSGL